MQKELGYRHITFLPEKEVGADSMVHQTLLACVPPAHHSALCHLPEDNVDVAQVLVYT
jgi:hypothetical protein